MFLLGVSLHDDLLYLFKRYDFPKLEKDAPELKTVERMTAIWANFAKTGEPIPEKNSIFKNVVWEKFTTCDTKYLDIGDELVTKTGLYANRMKRWDTLFPL